ncbi:MAG: response regulator [Hyphomicrobiales bacterium]|nr:response regulator [Hyphomicrobiales bacterium]
MSISKDIAPLLPYLRRFSRALNGSQESGDAYLTATLEYLLENPGAFSRELPPRVALYRVFIDVWSATCFAEPTLDPSTASAFDCKLATLSSRARQAFLLRTVEGFTIAEAVAAMRLDSARVNSLLERGAHDLAQELATKVLIIEDEPIVAMDLETIIEDLGHRVVGVARARRQAVALAAERKPELIMADIQLADGSSGLEAVNDILTGASKPVVFITAHPAKYLSAATNRPEPAFLLSKPFNPDSVRAAVSQALFFDRRARHAA